MKKMLLLFVLFLLFIAGCNKEEGDSGIIEIRENMFITQINSINLNYRDYLGKTIKLEGFLMQNRWPEKNMYYIIRKGPGCCGDDGDIGFEISWNPDYNGLNDNTGQRAFPNPGDWIQALGELRRYNFMGRDFLYIALSELNVMERRGAEFVTR